MYKIITLLIFVTIFSYSKEPKTKEIDIGNIINTASRVQTDIKESPGNSTIVTTEDIKLRPNTKFSDTIRGLDGIRTTKGRGMETFDSITIRGISGGTNVLVDGVSLNDMNNSTKMLTSMGAQDLEKVEVVRGPFSSLYGSGSLGGVINFITRMPEQLETNASIGYGNPYFRNKAAQNLVRGYVSLGDAYFNKIFKIKASYGWTTSKGYAADTAWTSSIENGVIGYIPTSSSTGSQRYAVGDMGRQSYGNHDARIKTQIDITDNDVLDIGFNYSNYNYVHIDQKTFLQKDGKPYYGSTVGNPNTSGTAGNIPYSYVGGMGNEKYNQFVEFIKYKHYFENQTLETNFSRIDGYDIWLGPNGDATPEGGTGKKVSTKHQKTAADILYNMDFLNEELRLLIGLDYKLLQLDVNNNHIKDWRYFGSNQTQFAGKSGGKAHFVGIFADVSGSLLNNMLVLSLGGRFDYWRGMNYYSIDQNNKGLPSKGNKKSAFSPKFSINYNPINTTTLKFSLGQAFRVPTLNQMFSTHILNDGTSILGNPNLKPETATSFDLGIEQETFTTKGLVKAYYFFTHLSNAIYKGNDKYQNAGAARLQGIELSYKQPLPLNFGIYTSYTLTHSRMIKNSVEPASVGKYLTGIPLHLGYIQTYYENYGFFGSIGSEFMSKPYARADNKDTISKVYGATDGYVLVDLKIGYNFNKHLKIETDFTNILNYKYYSYYRAPGSAFFVSLSGKY